MSQILLFATRNSGKIAELRVLLEGWTGIEVRSLEAYDVPEVVEDGETFAENAAKKALAVSRATGLPALADDSGLSVDALGGAPGVHSARYAGSHGDNAANNAKLLDELRGISERSAHFVSSLAVADCEGNLGTELLVSEGYCHGEILKELRGEGGFGYDPLFYFPPENGSFAELGIEVKNRHSHRGQAMKKLLPQLIEYFDLKKSE